MHLLSLCCRNESDYSSCSLGPILTHNVSIACEVLPCAGLPTANFSNSDAAIAYSINGTSIVAGKMSEFGNMATFPLSSSALYTCSYGYRPAAGSVK